MGVDASAVGGVSVARYAKLSYCTMPIHPSAHPNSWIIRIGIITALSTISFSRTVYMQISDLERSAASMSRISFAGARGAAICSFFPWWLAIVASTGSCTARVAPRFPGRDPIDLFAQFFVPMALISW